MSTPKSGIKLFGAAPSLLKRPPPATFTPEQRFAQAVALLREGRSMEAEAALKSLLQQAPQHFDALQMLGMLHLKGQRWEAGVEALQRAIALHDGFAPVYNNLSIGLRELGRVEESLAASDRALALKPDYLEAWINKGNTLRRSYRWPEALTHSDEALRHHPAEARLLLGKGLALQALERLEESAAVLRQALTLDPQQTEAHCALGAVLEEAGQPRQALDSLALALAQAPNHARAWNLRGLALQTLRQQTAADQAYRQAIALAPEAPEAHANLATLLEERGLYEQALTSYQKAIALGGERRALMRHVGDLHAAFRQHQLAVQTFRALCAIDPMAEFAQAGLLTNQMRCFDWRDLEPLRITVRDGLLEGQHRLLPFDALTCFDDLPLQLEAARQNVARLRAPRPVSWNVPTMERQRVRLAYVSGDFHDHATMHLMQEVFECHNREQFELIAVTIGPPLSSERLAWMERHFDRVIDAGELDDASLIDALRAMELDLAVDLKGHTRDARFEVFHQRIAPIQINYLGHPGTTGSESMDFILGDAVVTPLEHQPFYTEKIWQLPGCYQTNARLHPEALPPAPAPAEEGLPAQGFVFCCFNNGYKITPVLFDVWCDLLRAVDGSVLWLLGNEPDAQIRLQQEAKLRGIDPERLVFAQREPRARHLARHALADLFLDTLPYGAHTTASDALRMGGVMVTCQGNSFPARVGASLLTTIGCTDLIAHDLEQYRQLALDLALSPQRLAAARQQVRDGVRHSTLFEPVAFAKKLEAAYLAMLDARNSR
jgi:protein O-GlcNAc transferase